MPEENTTHKVKAVVTNESGEKVDEAIFDVSSSHDFAGLSAGTYKVTFTPVTNFKYIGENPITKTIGGCGCLFVRVSPEDIETEKILIKPILIPAIAVTTLAIIEPSLFSLYSRPVNQTPMNRSATNSSSQPPRQSSQASNISSLNIPSLSINLKLCIRNNLESLVDIPNFRSLVLPLFDEQITDDEFAERIIFLYERYEQVRAAIEDCDISAIVSFIEDADNDEEREQLFYQYVLVSSNNVNIRDSPSLNSTIIAQASNGEVYPIDAAQFNALSEAQKTNAVAGNGWFPILLANGEKAYIYSQYASLYPEETQF